MKEWSAIIGITVMVACAEAQWIPDGQPSVVDWQIITTGGVTYLRLVGQHPSGYCCQRIAGYAGSRQGSNVVQTIQHEKWAGGCVEIFCDPWQQELVSVLGALAPGEYQLTLTAESEFTGFPMPWASFTFTVPLLSGPTLTATRATNSSLLSIQVAGVSNVIYVLEASTNLTNWTALTTNLGAPVTFSASTTSVDHRFYRTVILPAPAR